MKSICCFVLLLFAASAYAQSPKGIVSPDFKGVFRRNVICQSRCYETIWITRSRDSLCAFVEYIADIPEIGDYSRSFEEKHNLIISRDTSDTKADYFLLDNDSKLRPAKQSPYELVEYEAGTFTNTLLASSEHYERQELEPPPGEVRPDYVFTHYRAEQAADSDPKTAWVVDGKEKAYIIALFKTAFVPKKLVIQNGYAKTPKTFANNNRVRSAKLIYSDGSEEMISLSDSPSVQVIPLRRTLPTDFVKMEILSVYPGKKYNETCISELSFE